ncbi:MAG: phosphoribosylpyrophosphate synthetase [Saprospiraceae bacterium]
MTIYSTLVEAINGLKAEGYTEDFNLRYECLECSDGKFKLYPDDFVIDKYFRFDVDSDAADQSIIYAISSHQQDLKGILVNSYGTYADDLTNEMVDKLHKE